MNVGRLTTSVILMLSVVTQKDLILAPVKQDTLGMDLHAQVNCGGDHGTKKLLSNATYARLIFNSFICSISIYSFTYLYTHFRSA